MGDPERLPPRTPKGRRYQRIALDGAQHALLFVRERRTDDRGVTMPPVLLGRCAYRTHRGARPMQIEWDLERPMPAGLYQETMLAVGSGRRCLPSA